MNRVRLAPMFLQGAEGRIFALLRAPENAERCVLFIPAFAEEMNKSRRQITEAALALNANGFAVLLIDLFGTGDSEGDFDDGSWEIWESDIHTAITWATDAGFEVFAQIATRLGCMLAASSLHGTNHRLATSVFWQPVESGKQFMTQFLRLRVAASMMEDDSKETVEGLRAALAADGKLEVAGYSLSSALLRSIDALKLTSLIHPGLGKLQIFEVGRTDTGRLSAVSNRLVTASANLGVNASGERISGNPFWAATEIVVNPQLADATAQYLASIAQR